MAYVNVYAVYSIEVPEVDEIYNEIEDPSLASEKLDELIEEIKDSPQYFIERNGYELIIEDVDL